MTSSLPTDSSYSYARYATENISEGGLGYTSYEAAGASYAQAISGSYHGLLKDSNYVTTSYAHSADSSTHKELPYTANAYSASYSTSKYDLDATNAEESEPGYTAASENYATLTSDSQDLSTTKAEKDQVSVGSPTSDTPKASSQRDPSVLTPVLKSPWRDWNVEFQSLRSLSVSTKEEILLKCRRYRDLAADFRSTAVRIGRSIIDEKWLPENRKTVKSVAVGGVAGGEKFIAEGSSNSHCDQTLLLSQFLLPPGIFFKFAIDNGMYQGEENAGKAAGLELRALDSIFQNYEVLWPTGINTVPMVLIDYHGWRLIATATLPLHGASLVYGSRDAGKTVEASNDDFNREMEKLGARLNLKPHRVGQIDPKILVAPVDIEGHIGSDGKWYIIDTARLMPPEAPTVRYKREGEYRKGWIWCRHLRSEALIRCPIRLNPDVYTGFNRNGDPKVCRSEVDRATRWIVDDLIPRFSERLSFETVVDFRFEQMLHDAGINIRMLANVRQHVKAVEVKRVLMEKMIARSCRSVVNEKLRAVRKGSEDNYFAFRETVAHHLNLLLGQSEEADMFFTATVIPAIADKFGYDAIENPVSPGVFLEKKELLAEIPSKASLLFTLGGLLAVTFTTEFVDKLFADANFFAQPDPVSRHDIVSVDAKVKVSANTLGEEGFRAAMNVRNLPPPTKLTDTEFSDLLDHFTAIYQPESKQLCFTLSALNGYELRDRQPDARTAIMAKHWPSMSATVAKVLNPYERVLLECMEPQQYLMWLVAQRPLDSIGAPIIQIMTLLGEGHPLLSRVLIYVARAAVQLSEAPPPLFPPMTIAYLRLAVGNFASSPSKPDATLMQWLELHHILESSLYATMARMRGPLRISALRKQLADACGTNSILEAWLILTIAYHVDEYVQLTDSHFLLLMPLSGT